MGTATIIIKQLLFAVYWCRYRAVFAYAPRHVDELEIQEGDIVEVMEKCDDGWFVGTSLRNNEFGTFPGNYVQPIDCHP